MAGRTRGAREWGGTSQSSRGSYSWDRPSPRGPPRRTSGGTGISRSSSCSASAPPAVCSSPRASDSAATADLRSCRPPRLRDPSHDRIGASATPVAFSSLIITDAPSQAFYSPRFMHIAIHRFGGRNSITSRHTEGGPLAANMGQTKNSGVGFLKATKARHAEEAIGQSEGLVTVLRLTQADLKPAEDSIRIAKHLFDAHQYAKAFHAAKRAESLALSLDERFNGYTKAAKALRSRIEAMRHLGLVTDTIEGIVRRAEEKILAGAWENGTFVPNYLEARVLVERAEHEGRILQEKAERASNAIFTAELAIERLVETQGPPDPIAFANGVGAPLEAALQDATRELAVGNAQGAALIARDLEAKATFLRTRFGEATKGLADAEVLYSRLQREGFQSYDADVALRDARRAVREGNYARAKEHLERALQAFLRRTNAKQALAKAIVETQTRSKLLQGSGLTFLPDSQDVLGRAEREFAGGNYAGSSEDLRLATVLLDQATRAPGPKK